MTDAILQHLAATDPVLGAIIARAGPCTLQPEARRTPFEALVRAVAHQQLNGKAAATILGRFTGLFPRKRFPSPDQLHALEPAKLTAVGFSRAKGIYLKEIARHTLEGLVPSRAQIARLPDEEIVERLTQIKGIGRWSVEMFLIFGLGRPDVLPVHDFGIRHGFALAYKKRKMPAPEQLAKYGARWKPFRTTAAWYLWRAVDLHRANRQAPLGLP